ncbi:MAG: STAS/SEC14 domain-containing protein [Proteobacteria bacterium]|nr:STAS/SEC14 domain-containing protein [Pseudomonadota bacterium]MBU1708514.1 STAS/SEC14 domain-containing protein [Pseudomonadota bacterium]
MIFNNLDQNQSVFHVRPTGPLRKEDFDELAKTVDPFIEKTGGLAGLILEIANFPGWEDIGAAVRHFRFVRDHHKKIKKVAVVTDSPMGNAAEHLASHFVSAQIKHFSAGQLEEARLWIAS